MASRLPNRALVHEARGVLVWSATVVRAMAPLYLLWLAFRIWLLLRWPFHERIESLFWWLWVATSDLSRILPFLLFAAGVALAEVKGSSARLYRIALVVGIALGGLSYSLGAWASPVLEDRYLARMEIDAGEMRRFGPATPPVILRNLRFVEARPSEEYSLDVGTPHRTPPNVLEWQLHSPVALAVFGMINVFLGILSAQVTAGLARAVRRNVRLTIGVFGGLLFFACIALGSPIQPFLDDGTLQSGILGAWAPLGLPLAEILVLFYMVRGRKP